MAAVAIAAADANAAAASAAPAAAAAAAWPNDQLMGLLLLSERWINWLPDWFLSRLVDRLND